ncbi:MAG TPA: hypothetical protein VGU01_01590 [Sphingomicrobium sp.]|nr:hypothetical protein [Sphingomicrobium sp.]
MAHSMTWVLRASACAAAVAVQLTSPAKAAGEEKPQAELSRLTAEVQAQTKLLHDQEARIEAQQSEIQDLERRLDNELASLRGTGLGQTASSLSSPPATPGGPVGEAPPQDTLGRAEVQAIPRELGVLTPAGHLVFDPSLEYSRSSDNRLVFRGIELVPGIQIGLIEASDVNSDTVIGTSALRYGLSDRLEVEALLPYVYRNSLIKVVEQRDQSIVRTIQLKGHDIGDAEATIRYQLNSVKPLRPIWIASLRIKSDTGKSPFDIPFDEFGVATGLATGSGFWGIEPGISFLLPSDPVVIYGGLAYLYQIPKNINRNIGGVYIGRVDPASAIEASIGFGFAVNPQFSFSLGYRHDYLFASREHIGDTVQRSDQLHAGRLVLGMSYRVTEKQLVNLGFEFGVTKDAPNMSVTLRAPLSLLN